MASRVTLLLVAAFMGVVLAGGSVSANGTVPHPVCSACGGQFEEAAADHGLDVQVNHSTAAVDIHANGSATWTVTNQLVNESAVQELRTSPDRLDAIATTATRPRIPYEQSRAWNEGAFRPDATHTTTQIDTSGTVTITFIDPSGAVRVPGGTLVVAYLHRDAGDIGFIGTRVVTINADRFTIIGPPDTTVTNDPPGGPAVRGRRISWRGTVLNQAQRRGQERFTGLEDIYVVFGPADGSTSEWRTSLAISVANTSLPFDPVSQARGRCRTRQRGSAPGYPPLAALSPGRIVSSCSPPPTDP